MPGKTSAAHGVQAPMLCLSPGNVDAVHADLPHVLLIVDGFPRTLGGGERVALRLAALLPRFGFQVSLLTFALDPEGEFQPASSPFPVYLLPLRRTYDLTALRGAVALRSLLKSRKIQIVQTFFESSDLWAGLIVRLASRAKLVWSRRDMGILRGPKHAFAYRALRHLPHAVFAVSDQVRRHALEVDGIPPARLFTVHNGLDALALGEHTTSGARPLAAVTTVGNIRRVKGHDLLVRAAAQVVTRFPEATFSVAGEVLDPDYFADLQRLVQDLGLAGKFHFLGRASDVRAHLLTAGLFVLPSRSEGFSNALIEAMAAGLPVVATDVGGNAEAMEPGVSGLLIPSEDVSALASAICALLSAPETAARMGAAGRQRVLELFTAEAMTDKTAQTFRALLQR